MTPKTMRMESVFSSESLITFYMTTKHHIPTD